MDDFLTLNFSNIQTISLFEINLTASLLILAVMIFRGVLKNRNPKRFFASLWIIVLLRLIIPFSVPLMINLFPPDYYTSLNRLSGEHQVFYYDKLDEATYYYNEVTPDVATSTAETGFNLSLIALIFGIGAFLVFVFLHLRNRKRYAEALPLSDERINALIKSYGLKRNISVKYSDRISAPITYGVFKPIIILPKACLETDFEKLQCIISHEIAHIRHFDIVYKWIITAITCAYWYNPFIWIMFVLSDKDIETACDREAIELCGCSKDDYSNLLISLEEKRCTDILARGFTAGAIKKRIKSIMKAKKSGVFSCVLAVIMSVASFTVFTSAHTGLNTGLSIYVPVMHSTIDDHPYDSLLWLEPQRYYLEGGTKEEYIEIFDDGTFQVFGFDFLSFIKENESEDYVITEEDKAKAEQWKNRYKYDLFVLGQTVFGYEGNEFTVAFSYYDENTFVIRGNKYIAEKPWKADKYQAYRTCEAPGSGYYYAEDGKEKIFFCTDVFERFDKNGKSKGVENYVLVKTEEEPNKVFVATNFDRLKTEEIKGFIYDIENLSVTEIESGKTYTLGSKPIFS